MSRVLANSMTESSCCFWKCNRISGHRFCIMVCWNFGLIVIYISAPIIGSWWWVVMAVCHCYSWQRWWLKLCEQLSRLYQHSLLCYLQCFVVEISLQSSWIWWNDRFRVQRTQEWSYWWNVGFTFVRGAALPVNTPGVPCIFDAHARVGICGDWLLGSSLEAAALSGMALAHHVSTL